MDIIDIERALLNFGRLAPAAAEERYPRLSQELLLFSMGGRNAPRQASTIRHLLEDLRLEQDAKLVEEARRLIDTKGSLQVVREGAPE